MLVIMLALVVGAVWFAAQVLVVLVTLGSMCREIEDAGGDVDGFLREVEQRLAVGDPDITWRMP